MEKRIETIEGVTIYGFEMKGPTEEIPALWEKLNGFLCDQKIAADVSYGVTLEVLEGEFRYLAGVSAEEASSWPDVSSVVIPEGRFLVGRVEGGTEMIPAMFDTLMQTPDVDMRYSYGFERYIHPDPSKPYETEVWVAIE